MLSDILIKVAFMSNAQIDYYIDAYKRRVQNLMTLDYFCQMENCERAKERLDILMEKSNNLALLKQAIFEADKQLTSLEKKVLNCKIFGRTKRGQLLLENEISVATYRSVCRRAYKKLNKELSLNWRKDELFIDAFNDEQLVIRNYKKCKELEKMRLRPLTNRVVIKNGKAEKIRD